MRSNNPVLKNLPQAEQQQGYGYQGQHGQMGQPGYEPAAPETDRPMTVDDVVSKTGITLAVIIVFAVANFMLSLTNPGLGMMVTFGGGIAAFITVLVSAFSKSYGSKVTTLLYAAFEGLFVGGFSFLFANVRVGDSTGMGLVFQAIVGTIGVFIGMLVVYRTGAIRVTPRFNRILTGLIFGVAIMALGNFLLAIFTDMNPLRGGGTLSIIFGLVCVVLAALSFLQDFDVADKLVRTGAPQKAAWGVALGLAVTLVWLYTEILRLLYLFQER